MVGLESGTVATQLGLIAGLRWRIFRNSLRTWRARTDLIAFVLLAALASAVVIAIAAGFSVMTYFFLKHGKTEQFVVMLWSIFVVWQFVPLLAAASAEFEFRNLLRLPLRFPVFFLLNVMYGLLDGAALVGMAWLVAIGVGLLFARPGMLLWGIVTLMLFALLNLLLNRLILSWLARLLARRRTREAMFVILMLGMMSIQLFGPISERWGKHTFALPHRVLDVATVLPPGAAARALSGAARGEVRIIAPQIILLTAYGFGFGVLLRRRLRAQYLGEDLGESEAPVPTGVDRAAQPGWKVPGLREPIAAMFEKEVHYLFRNGPMLLTLIMPFTLILFFVFAWSGPQAKPAFLAPPPDMIFPSLVAYVLLILAGPAQNSFAVDGWGVQVLLLAPVSFRDVLLAKNLVVCLVTSLEACLIWMIVAIQSPPGAIVATTTFLGLSFATLVNLTVGNLLSLYFPRRVEFGKFSQRQYSQTSLLIGLVAQFLVLATAGAIFFVARRSGQLWWATMAFLALSAAAWKVYLLCLDRCALLAARWREVLIAELCRP